MDLKQNRLSKWIDEEDAAVRKLQSGPGAGIAGADDLRTRTGLEFVHAISSGELPYAHIARTLDFITIEFGDGFSLVQGAPQLAHANPLGTIHGGWIAALLDSALGCAVHTKLPLGHAFTTSQLSVNYVKGISMEKTSRVRAEAKVVHCGRQLVTAEARVFDVDETLYAHATTSCLVFDTRLR